MHEVLKRAGHDSTSLACIVQYCVYMFEGCSFQFETLEKMGWIVDMVRVGNSGDIISIGGFL